MKYMKTDIYKLILYYIILYYMKPALLSHYSRVSVSRILHSSVESQGVMQPGFFFFYHCEDV